MLIFEICRKVTDNILNYQTFLEKSLLLLDILFFSPILQHYGYNVTYYVYRYKYDSRIYTPTPPLGTI